MSRQCSVKRWSSNLVLCFAIFFSLNAIPCEGQETASTSDCDREVMNELPKSGIGATGRFGFVIKGFVNTSPAEVSGLKEGDIITEVDSMRVNSLSSIQDRILNSPTSTGFNIGYMRYNPLNEKVEKFNTFVETQRLPRNEENGAFESPKPTLGVFGTVGFVILNFVHGGPAEAAGLKEGDVLTRLNGEEFPNLREFMTRLMSSLPGTSIQIQFLRFDPERSHLVSGDALVVTRSIRLSRSLDPGSLATDDILRPLDGGCYEWCTLTWPGQCTTKDRWTGRINCRINEFTWRCDFDYCV